MINRLSSLRPLLFQSNFFLKRSLTSLLPLMQFQPRTNLVMTPRVIMLLQNQFCTATRAYTKALDRPIHIPDSPKYDEVTRRIKPHEKENIENQIQNLFPSIQKRFIQFVTSGNWDDILSITNYPNYALKSLREGAISPEDFASIMLPWSSPDYRKQCIEIFSPSGEISPTARNLIEQTLLIDEIPYLSDSELDHFFDLLSQESPIQKQFFLEARKTKALGDIQSLLELDSYRSKFGEIFWGFNCLSSCQVGSNPMYMIPSLGMMNCFLKAKFGKNAMVLNPVLGVSTPKDLENSVRLNLRDFAVRFPGISLPQTADGLGAEGFNFSYHDFTHAAVASCASPITRKRLLQCSQIASPSNYDISEFDETQLSYLYQEFVDMNFFFHYFDLFMGKDRPEWQRFLEEILFHISKSELSKSLKLAILKEIFQSVLKNPEEKSCVKNWIGQMSNHLETYVYKGTREIQLLDEQIGALYQEIGSLKQRFQKNPSKTTTQLFFANQKVSTLKNKRYLYKRVLDLIQVELNLSLKNEHIFQQVLQVLPRSFSMDSPEDKASLSALSEEEFLL